MNSKQEGEGVKNPRSGNAVRGGLGGAVATVIVFVSAQFGVEMGAEMTGALAIIAGAVLSALKN